MKFDGFGLLDGFSDFRQAGQRRVAVFSPVGDGGQLRDFVAHVKRLGIEGQADFVFIFRKGMDCPRTGLSELRCLEKAPIGTSGCFFAGQALCHSLGYETVVLADLDAFLDSKKTFDSMVRMAGERKCAVVPISRAPGGKADGGEYFVINQWGVLPREALDAAGFAIPYTLRGGEDWEFSRRLSSCRKLFVYKQGSVAHPRAGRTIYHKMADGRKFYPYVAGLMRGMLFSSQYSKSSYFLYLAWYSYYSFLSDAFGEASLRELVAGAHKMEGRSWGNSGKPKFFAEAPSEDAAFQPAWAQGALFMPLSLVWLVFFGRLRIAGEGFRMAISRPRLAFGIAIAALLLPIRLLQAALSLASWQETKKKFPFPPTPANLEKVSGAFLGEIGAR
ncbi:MAG: hypothetical protein WC717_05220 [Candidatus Micrarchaeia archaeon]